LPGLVSTTPSGSTFTYTPVFGNDIESGGSRTGPAQYTLTTGANLTSCVIVATANTTHVTTSGEGVSAEAVATSSTQITLVLATRAVSWMRPVSIMVDCPPLGG